jgi:micrococcal nuclease
VCGWCAGIHNRRLGTTIVGPARHDGRVRARHVVAGAAVVAAVLVGHQLTKGPSAPAAVDPGAVESPAIPADAFAARIDRVVDGDTFLATTADSSKPVRVRVIGVDTPETVKPGTPVRCYGPQASAFTKHLLPAGTTVRADHEPGGDIDAFGRQLWDVWLPDGRFLESVLTAAGAARAYPYPPQTEYSDLLARLATAARQTRRGLWGPPCNGDSFG